MNYGMFHTEAKVVLESVVAADSRYDVGPLNAHVLRKLPIDLDLINGFDLNSKKGFHVFPPIEKSDAPIVKLNTSCASDKFEDVVTPKLDCPKLGRQGYLVSASLQIF